MNLASLCFLVLSCTLIDYFIVAYFLRFTFVLLLKMDDTKEDFSHLPPTQQKKKLAQRIESLKQVVEKSTAER